jgi:hypothetical protein
MGRRWGCVLFSISASATNFVTYGAPPSGRSYLQYHQLAMPPLPTDVFHVTSVAAALQKLNVEIPIKEIIKVIHDEEELLEEAKLVNLAAEATRQDERKSVPDPDQAAQSENESVRCAGPPADVPKSKPISVDPSRRERRCRLVELTQQEFLNDFRSVKN